jgi:mono/diheme cytochrome c family protein
MKKVAAWILGVLGALVLAALIFVFGLRPRVRPAPSLTAAATPELVARGDYLANHVALCPACHSDAPPFHVEGARPEQLWVGRDIGTDMKANGDQGVAGALTSRNLTSSKEHGVGQWTDGEIVRAIRDGASREGRGLFPMMPYQEYALGLTEEDTLAIVAYLRTLPAKDQGPATSKPGFVGGLLGRLLTSPAPAIARVQDGSEEHGQRLLRSALCVVCHNSEKASPQEPDYAGGKRAWGLVIPNITSDPNTGIGRYTEDEIIRVLEGTKSNGSKVREMPSYLYRGMSDSDKRAIAKAVKALPPVVGTAAN